MRKSCRKRIIKLFSTVIITMGITLMFYPLYSDLFSVWYEKQLHTVYKEHQSFPLSSTSNPVDGFQGMILEIPAINLSTAVQKGTSIEILKKTPGWFEESKLPGQGNTAIAGHLNMYGGWFRHLDQLNTGDVIYLQFDNKKYIYQTVKIFSVNSTQVDIIDDCGYAALTLTTCLDGDSYQRLVIRAKLEDSINMSV